MLLKADNEPAIQALGSSQAGREDDGGKSPKYSHQSNGVIENAERRIESLTRTYVCVCVAGEAWLQSRQQEHCSTVACQARGVRAQSICEAR